MASNSFGFLGANLQFGIVLICCSICVHSVTQSLLCGRRFRPRPRATARPYKAARFESGSGRCCSALLCSGLVWPVARANLDGVGVFTEPIVSHSHKYWLHVLWLALERGPLFRRRRFSLCTSAHLHGKAKGQAPERSGSEAGA